MKEWYLMTPRKQTTSLGGYEVDAFCDYKDAAFNETVNSDIGDTVEIYNHDLSQVKIVRCKIQGNSPESQLKSLERIGLFEHNTVKAGMYVKYDSCYWLVYGYPSYNGVYEKAILQLCQCKIRWQIASGDIVERWCNVTSASKYDVGEFSNNSIILSSNNYTVLTPADEDTYLLDGKRVFIDWHNTNPTKTFKLTRADDVLYKYGEEHGGVFGFIADKTELNVKVDRPDLQVCDYVDTSITVQPPQTTIQTVNATIFGRNNITIGYSRNYSVKFKNQSGEEVDIFDYTWDIDCGFKEQVQCVRDDKTLKVTVQDSDLIGQSFKVQIIHNSDIMAEKTVIIEDTY